MIINFLSNLFDVKTECKFSIDLFLVFESELLTTIYKCADLTMHNTLTFRFPCIQFLVVYFIPNVAVFALFYHYNYSCYYHISYIIKYAPLEDYTKICKHTVYTFNQNLMQFLY